MIANIIQVQDAAAIDGLKNFLQKHPEEFGSSAFSSVEQKFEDIRPYAAAKWKKSTIKAKSHSATAILPTSNMERSVIS